MSASYAEKTRLLPSSLSRFLEEQRISIIYAVPSNLGLLANRGLLDKRDLTAMRIVLFAGEVFPLPLFRDFRARMPAGLRYCNLYGPTETNVCTWFDTVELTADDTAMPIGRALPGTALLTDPADDADEPELCVAGPAVMSGYLGDPERTDIWLETDTGERAYRTGDRVLARDDGNWLYFGPSRRYGEDLGIPCRTG